MNDEVVQPDARNEKEPHRDDRSKCVANLVGPETLDREEHEQDRH